MTGFKVHSGTYTFPNAIIVASLALGPSQPGFRDMFTCLPVPSAEGR
jgi:hypothetical protein